MIKYACKHSLWCIDWTIKWKPLCAWISARQVSVICQRPLQRPLQRWLTIARGFGAIWSSWPRSSILFGQMICNSFYKRPQWSHRNNPGSPVHTLVLSKSWLWKFSVTSTMLSKTGTRCSTGASRRNLKVRYWRPIDRSLVDEGTQKRLWPGSQQPQFQYMPFPFNLQCNAPAGVSSFPHSVGGSVFFRTFPRRNLDHSLRVIS